MLIGMLFRSMLVVLGGMKRMAVRDLRMVGCFFMMPGLRMFGGFSVVPGGMFVMFSSFLVVFVNCVLLHDGLPSNSGYTPRVYQRHNEANVTSYRSAARRGGLRSMVVMSDRSATRVPHTVRGQAHLSGGDGRKARPARAAQVKVWIGIVRPWLCMRKPFGSQAQAEVVAARERSRAGRPAVARESSKITNS